MTALSEARKLQRWIDLVTALLARRYGATLDELRTHVPGYASGELSSVRRTFERDKDDLRNLGVPIETVGKDGEEETRYVIAGNRFYLPYLSIVTPRGRARPTRVDRYGYQALAERQFSDDELQLLSDAAARVMECGDPMLTDDATHALRKLAIDVPADQMTPTPHVQMLPAHSPANEATLHQLGEALRCRKQVTFTYYGIERDETERRVVQAYGLSFTSGHWYLHAMDPSRGAVRVFRVSRMHEVVVNPKAPNTQDYEIPRSFVLRDRAVPRPPWELGEDPVVETVVRFTRNTGVVRAARQKGIADPADPSQVRYTVRRREAFHRWLLGLAGDAVPVSPPDMVREYFDLARRTLDALEMA